MKYLILAGTDTTSNALTAMMCTLAQRRDIQDKLRAEILDLELAYGPLLYQTQNTRRHYIICYAFTVDR